MCPPRVCSPVLWKFCSQVPLASRVKLPGVVSAFARSPGWGSAVGPGTSVAVQRILGRHCSPVCGSSAPWLCGEASGDLLHVDLCHTLCLPGLLQPETLTPLQTTADPCLCKKHSNTQRQVWLHGSPHMLEYVVYPFFSGSSWPRNEIGVSCIAGGFFTAELPGKSSGFFLVETGLCFSSSKALSTVL